MPSLFRAVVLLALLAVTAAACGGDGDAGATTTTSTVGATSTTTATTRGGEGAPVDGDTVAVHYTGTLDDGEEFDSSRDREPLQFVVGSGQVIGGFDDAVRGLVVGESVVVRIAPEDAYGEVDPERILEFPIEEVPEEFRQVGVEVLLGGTTPATVIEVTEDTVTVDANHRLAGEALTFDIELVEIIRP